MTKMPYPIGLPGIKWGEEEKQSWLAKQSVKRSYLDDVVSQINQLANAFDIEQYGALSYEHNHYPLFVLKSLQWDDNKPTVLITGGVHGYETSGVQGALRFSATQSSHYQSHFNFLVVPCVSPWGYETINRWNPKAIDPNRSFYPQSPAEEAALLMKYISGFNINVHIDLHETTDTDNSEFRPALAARDAVTHDNWNIPDGFYLVADTTKPMPDFQQAVIQAVEKVTHIAPADDNNKLIGETVQQWGVINYAARDLGLCMGLTDAEYVTTTEVYPDSSRSDDENCILAQVAAVTGALNFVIDQG